MRFLLAIPAALYSLVLRIRHWLYDAKVLRRYIPDIPVVCVGNITVGGTGKTPVTEYLIRLLSKNYTVAVLSRGYKRRTKGYLEVETNSSFLNVGDEPKQIKRKFPDTLVVVCEDREEGIRRIRKEHPGVNLILMDDGFQHRSVEPRANIILMDYNRPIYRDHMMPWGRLRDIPSQIRRAGIILVTKTPGDMSPIERRLVTKSMKLYPYQSIYFTSMKDQPLRPLFPDNEGLVKPGEYAAVMAGVGNPEAFRDSLADKYNIVGSFFFRDHYTYKVRDLRKIEQQMAGMPEGTIMVTTEKDAVKLCSCKHVPAYLQDRLYVLPIGIEFHKDDEPQFVKTLYKDIKDVR